MYYRMILTYNFSDDDTRSSFEELVEVLGFVEAEDQSTDVLPYVVQKQSKDVTEPIVIWSEDKDIKIYTGHCTGDRAMAIFNELLNVNELYVGMDVEI